jgi:hypothetical protein
VWKNRWDRCMCSQGYYFEGDCSQDWLKLTQHFFSDLVLNFLIGNQLLLILRTKQNP